MSGRWAVLEVLEVRRVGRRIDVKMAWEGFRPAEESEEEGEEADEEPREDSCGCVCRSSRRI